MCAFLRCESPSAFLGTCISHHSFIILLITSTSALLTGLYLISTMNGLRKWLKIHPECVNALSGLYLISTRNMSRDQMMLLRLCVNALSGLYLISTSERVHMNLINFFVSMPSRAYTSFLRRKWIVCSGTGFGWCQCPLGLIPHFYGVDKGNTDHEEFFCVNALSGLYLISTGL